MTYQETSLSQGSQDVGMLMDDPSTNMKGAQGAEIGCAHRQVHMKRATGSLACLLQAVVNSHAAIVTFKLCL